MALTQMQIIQSLGDAMSWFERELQWGVPPTELRHLSGRIGELYAALITNGQMATEVNQKGYDVVSSNGEKISVKTTAMMGRSGHISFNPNTLNNVNKIIILRINTEEMQIETLLNATVQDSQELMTSQDSNGKVSISLSKLIGKPKDISSISIVNSVKFESYEIQELENGTILVKLGNETISPTRPVLREVASKLNVSITNGNGNPFNTRQLGSLIVKVLKDA
jgi:uncharacterized protein YheU (UPF0270 family)